MELELCCEVLKQILHFLTSQLLCIRNLPLSANEINITAASQKADRFHLHISTTRSCGNSCRLNDNISWLQHGYSSATCTCASMSLNLDDFRLLHSVYTSVVAAYYVTQQEYLVECTSSVASFVYSPQILLISI